MTTNEEHVCGTCKYNKRDTTADNAKRRWENAFQKWSNSQMEDDYTSLGKCGYGSICDYCKDNSYGRPCVRALNEMLRETGKSVDYNNYNFEDIW